MATAEEAVVAAAEGELRLPSVIAGLALSAARLLAGEPDKSVRVLLDLGGGDELAYLPLRWKPAGYELLTRGLLALDRHREAVIAASRAASCARKLGLPTTVALADRAAAAVALDSGDPKESARRAATAAEDGESLTDRELEVAQLMSQGKTNREIAAELFVSRKTIETHLHHVFGKLGVATRTEAARVLLWKQASATMQ